VKGPAPINLYGV